jgi:hypothetical protein
VRVGRVGDDLQQRALQNLLPHRCVDQLAAPRNPTPGRPPLRLRVDGVKKSGQQIKVDQRLDTGVWAIMHRSNSAGKPACSSSWCGRYGDARHLHARAARVGSHGAVEQERGLVLHMPAGSSGNISEP